MKIIFIIIILISILWSGINLLKNEVDMPIPKSIKVKEKLYERLSLQCEIAVYEVSEWSLENISPYKKIDAIDGVPKDANIREMIVQNGQIAKDCLPETIDKDNYVETIEGKKNILLYDYAKHTLLVFNTESKSLYVSRGSR